MSPIDYRNATWDAINRRITGMRHDILLALAIFGPCTTRELARRGKLDILTVRPRVTELVQMGFVQLVDDSKPAHEGVYRVLSIDEAKALYVERRAAALAEPKQTELGLEIALASGRTPSEVLASRNRLHPASPASSCIPAAS